MTAPPKCYELVRCVDDLEDMLDTIGDGVAALDFETTAFTPSDGAVRLVQIYNEQGWWVVDFFDIGRDILEQRDDLTSSYTDYREGFRMVAAWFSEAAWIVFNAGFEMMWFEDATDKPITCWDVALLRKAVLGGGHFSLAKALKEDLDHSMPKEEQASNWAAEPLRQAQLDYAADDALWTWRLWKHWRLMADEGHMQAFNMLNDLQPAVLEMQRSGMRLDPDRHRLLIEKWKAMEAQRVADIRELVSEEDIENLNSGAQWSDFFNRILPDEYLALWPKTKKTGLLCMGKDELKDVSGLFSDSLIGELINLKMELTTVRKYLSSFGESLIYSAERGGGRIHARYNIAAARTCRFSCSGPNLQQIPRDREFFGDFLSVRQSFIADPGNELVSLDYSGIELRVLALLSGDEALLHDVVYGDVHLEVGSMWQKRPLDKSVKADKELRSKAKGVSFGIIYGSTALGLAGTMRVPISEAEELMALWGDRYPEAMAYAMQAKRAAERNGNYLRVVDGGTIYMGKEVSRTQAANYPVQRGALSVMAYAIYRHKETLDAYNMRSDVKMLASIHDALIDEASMGVGEDVLHMMAEDMKAGYLDVFPGAPTDRLVEGGVGPNWGELEEREI